MSKALVLFFGLFSIVILTECKSKDTVKAYESETLKIIPLSENSFIHVSYLQTETFGKVACNGLIYLNDGEAAVFDTPSDRKATLELINWLSETQHQKIKGLVINHFHIDAMGGIEEFSLKGIPTYGNKNTENLITSLDKRPSQVFEEALTLRVGQSEVHNRFFGEAHTVDNIVSYIPDEELLYGGCMIKSLQATKGNLEDANVKDWSKTVEKIKEEFPNLKTVVPGHGSHGDTELLDYTISLFKLN